MCIHLEWEIPSAIYMALYYELKIYQDVNERTLTREYKYTLVQDLMRDGIVLVVYIK